MMTETSSYAADTSSQSMTETSVQERVRDRWADDWFMIDIDANRNRQWQGDGSKSKARRGEQCGRNEELDKLLCKLIVCSTVGMLSNQ